MTRTHAYQMTAAACCLAVLLAGCATTNGPVPMPQAPAPVETPDVKTVKVSWSLFSQRLIGFLMKTAFWSRMRSR